MISTKSLEKRIKKFEKDLPYTKQPYCKKSWGDTRHSLCSYQGKLKPSIAHWLIREFVKEGGLVLDPIGGVGTIAFEASRLGRKSVTNDKSPFAATVAKAKVSSVSYEDFIKVFEKFREKHDEALLNEQSHSEAEFGLNARVIDYYHPETLKSILKLRKIFSETEIDDKKPEECLFWSCLLHILHGNRPYALSRNSHSITPFSPTGEFVYKDVFEKIKEKALRTLQSLPDEYIDGDSLFGDFRDIPSKVNEKFDAIITSPPFYGMRFDRPNWLRLWFCGWKESSFKEDSLEFLERQQVKDISVYKDFFNMARRCIEDDGVLILHLGKGGKKDMSEELKGLANEKFVFVGEVVECVKRIANHGIKDKGLTIAHNLMFFTPRKG